MLVTIAKPVFDMRNSTVSRLEILGTQIWESTLMFYDTILFKFNVTIRDLVK